MKWTLRHRNPSTQNILTGVWRDGIYIGNSGDIVFIDNFSSTELIPVNYNFSYQVNKKPGSDGLAQIRAVWYDYERVPMSLSESSLTTFTPPEGAFYAVFVLNLTTGAAKENLSITVGIGSAYSDAFLYRQIYPVYKTLSKVTERQTGQYYFRDKIDGVIKLVRDDYDYIQSIGIDFKIYVTIEGDAMFDTPFEGYFYKTDCKFNDDDRNVEIRINTNDLYEDLLNGMDKEFNLIRLAPALNTIISNRRPILQVYCRGDNVVTNYVGGTYWEEQIQIDPVYAGSTLVNTYKFAFCKHIGNIDESYASSLSVDVTGDYGENGIHENGLYKIVGQLYVVPNKIRYKIIRISDDAVLYQTIYTETSINAVIFEGVEATGSFYVSSYSVYARLLLPKSEFNGTAAYERPDNDITPYNRNYLYTIGYETDNFYIFDGVQNYPSEYGRVPDDGPNPGKYYKQYLVSLVAGLTNPMPLSPSNWRSASAWYVRDQDARYMEYIENSEHEMRDCFELSDVINVLLRSIGSNVFFDKVPECSSFLYSATNPLGVFQYKKVSGSFTVTATAGNIRLFFLPKSNVMNGEYDEPAMRADITLQSVFNFLRDTLKLYWFIENGRLRIEHVSFFQKGLSYTANQIGYDTTTIISPNTNTAWGTSQNKWEFDKENMPERYEYGWMDEVSRAFKGFPIIIKNGYVQKDRKEDMFVGSVTTDLDHVQASPGLVSRDGFVVIAAVDDNGTFKTPVLDMEIGLNQLVSLNNGFMSFLYLHQRFHLYDLPGSHVNVNGEDMFLALNNNRMKKQDIEFPIKENINPYQLIKTAIGDGIAEKISLNLESQYVKATIKHDTE